jgi:hypothetical protein
VRDVIHDFNTRGLAALDPNWAAGRLRRITARAQPSPATLGPPTPQGRITGPVNVVVTALGT